MIYINLYFISLLERVGRYTNLKAFVTFNIYYSNKTPLTVKKKSSDIKSKIPPVPWSTHFCELPTYWYSLLGLFLNTHIDVNTHRVYASIFYTMFYNLIFM